MARDLIKRTSTYLTVFGWISLVGLNLAGLLYLYLATRLVARSKRARLWTIWIFGIQAMLFVILTVLQLSDALAPRLKFWGNELSMGHLPMFGLLGIAIALHSLPVVWLMNATVRRQFNREPSECSGCGYDLRATPDRCPECGHVPADGKMPRDAEAGT